MEQQKIYTVEEIDYILSCCEPNHDGLIDYRELTERFHNPAKEIGFNLAVLLTNLSEHMPSDPRLQRFLEIASSVLNYFEPFLGRIEIMGSAKRVERVYFEIKESSINQWEKPQIKESKRAFFYSMITEGGDKEKLELFVNFCEDAIFEMQHAVSISMEEESHPPSASEYPYLSNSQISYSSSEFFGRLLQLINGKVITFFRLLTPSNVRKQFRLMKEKSAVDLLIGMFKLAFKFFVFSSFTTYQLTSCIFRFIFRLMAGEPVTGFLEEAEIQQRHKALTSLPYSSLTLSNNGQIVSSPVFSTVSNSVEDSRGYEVARSNKEIENDISKFEVVENQYKSNGDATLEERLVGSNDRRIKKVTITEPNYAGGVEKRTEDASSDSLDDMERSEMSSQSLLVSSFNFGNYVQRFICFLARNFYKMKYFSLFIAFIINFILLFYKVSDAPFGSTVSDLDDSGPMPNVKLDINLHFNQAEKLDTEEELDEWAAIEEKLFYLSPVLRILALLHSTLAIFMLIGYYHLKLPLAIFKREKEISRSMEFDGLYISHQKADDDIKAHWDKLVISTVSFPVNYWDKFVKKRVRETYSEQYDYDQISNLLGMAKGGISSKQLDPKGWFNFIKSIDIQYQIWKAGVTITEPVRHFFLNSSSSLSETDAFTCFRLFSIIFVTSFSLFLATLTTFSSPLTYWTLPLPSKR